MEQDQKDEDRGPVGAWDHAQTMVHAVHRIRSTAGSAGHGADSVGADKQATETARAVDAGDDNEGNRIETQLIQGVKPCQVEIEQDRMEKDRGPDAQRDSAAAGMRRGMPPREGLDMATGADAGIGGALDLAAAGDVVGAGQGRMPMGMRPMLIRMIPISPHRQNRLSKQTC